MCEAYRVDKKRSNQFDMSHKMALLKQPLLGHGGDSCYGLTHNCLLRRAKTLGRE